MLIWLLFLAASIFGGIWIGTHMTFAACAVFGIVGLVVMLKQSNKYDGEALIVGIPAFFFLFCLAMSLLATGVDWKALEPHITPYILRK